MTITLRPATEADAPSLARIATAAFANSLSPLIFPRSQLATATITEADLFADEVTWRESMLTKRLREDKPCVVAVEVDDSTGQEISVLGFAHWQKPGPEAPEVRGVEVRPATYDRSMFLRIVEKFTEKDREALGERGHEEYWYAILISVDPKQHRRGVGRKLVNWGLECARKEGRDAYLTATEAGKPLYEVCGFEALETYDCYGVPLTSMVWRLEKNQQ
ncbi:acyl-CoA N-acyltransferase [Copromyces sp. CBS 386.78]|nr:acyl-CoA N-acyltransferase [Copromyces sp. CBS 386.78]